MIQANTNVHTAAERPRAERRIAIRLPLTVRGRDSRGVTFVEETSSENLCRGGAAFVTRFDVAVGSDLEILIPFNQRVGKRKEPDFSTQGKVVHVRGASSGPGEFFVGVQFTGPRFRRFFHSESAA